jgi:hypothetical protein
LALGYANVDTMLASMSASMLVEWQAYFALEPWGSWRDEMRVARLCAVISEPNRDRKAHPKPFSVTEFLPEWMRDELGTDEARSEKPDILKAKMSGFARLLNTAKPRRAANPKRAGPPSRAR